MDITVLKEKIKEAQGQFHEYLTGLSKDGGLTKKRYIAYLSMQYHLTKNVQEHFYRIAGSEHLAFKKNLKDFLVNFGNEEEHHFKIAGKDLHNLGVKPNELGLDVMLWKSFFDKIIPERPFLRLGATCILENISGTSTDLIKQMMASADYLNPKNTMFVVIHMHGEELPHGDQILEIMQQSDLNKEQYDDLVLGAQYGKTMYLRMFMDAMNRV